jgi:hypothetical protein
MEGPSAIKQCLGALQFHTSLVTREQRGELGSPLVGVEQCRLGPAGLTLRPARQLMPMANPMRSRDEPAGGKVKRVESDASTVYLLDHLSNDACIFVDVSLSDDYWILEHVLLLSVHQRMA